MELNFPLILRKDDQLLVGVYNEKEASLTELTEDGAVYTGDYRECEVVFNPAHKNRFAHASTTHLRYSEVRASGDSFTFVLLFEMEVGAIIKELQFSPCGKYLVAFSTMDAKRAPNGNLLVLECETGKVIKQVMQSRWPALVWTGSEEFCVRVVNNCLHVLNGALSGGSEDGSADGGALCKMNLNLPQDKEAVFSASPSTALPLLAVFIPFHKQQPASLVIARLPNLLDPLLKLSFARSEAAEFFWSTSGDFVAFLVSTERDPSGKNYYGTARLHIVDVKNKSVADVKLSGEGDTVHYCAWSPTSDELLVVHGRMPRNKVTLFNKKGIALLTFGEAPRNMADWSPDGKEIVMGGSGNLAGDYKFYSIKPSSTAVPSATPNGSLNDKCSFTFWAPDSHNFLCTNVFTKLRVDNKVAFYKTNGECVVTKKFPMLYGAHWVQMKATKDYAPRPASPVKTTTEVKEKPQAYRAPGNNAPNFHRPKADAAEVKAAGPPGSKLVEKKKRRR
ncbi:translation initiation factor 2A [Angomonas deanei]|nr:translation initiation factor 2A [Angomonas deanei]|eukprot:EPY40788.1 translation initiation factor 2A [Angomonas deanei]